MLDHESCEADKVNVFEDGAKIIGRYQYLNEQNLMGAKIMTQTYGCQSMVRNTELKVRTAGYLKKLSCAPAERRESLNRTEAT
jgi:hypothetical protein